MSLDLFLLFMFTVLSASFSSFLIASDYRGWKNLGRSSSCDNCQEKISSFSLIPVFGSLLTGFKCKKCNKKYSSKMCIMELSAGLLFIGLFYFAKLNGVLVIDTENIYPSLGLLTVLAFIAGLFSLIAHEDWNNHTISDIYILSTFILLAIMFFDNLQYAAFYLAGTYVFKMIADNIYFYIKGGEEEVEALGGGDVMLVALAGFFIHFLTLSHVILLMAIFAIVMTKVSGKEQLAPLAPNFLWALIVVLFMNNIFV